MHSNGRLRVAIIGTGRHRQRPCPGYLANTEWREVVAVCDVEEQRARQFAERYSFGTPYSDVTTLLREERPDAVSICTPNFLHAPLTIQALEAGASVLCEKPMATTLADAQAMKDASQRTGKALYIGFNHRFIGKFRLGKDLLDSGDYGKLLTARIAIGHGDYARLSGHVVCRP